MGSSEKKNTTKAYRDLPDWLKGSNQQLVNNILNNANEWQNHKSGTLSGNIYENAIGNNLDFVNEREQALLNKVIDQQNNAINRQFAGAGRSGSFSSLNAITNATSKLENQFLADNINRNRQSQLAAQAQYLNGLSGFNNQALNAVDQNKIMVNETITPGKSAIENIMGGLGVGGSLISAIKGNGDGGGGAASGSSGLLGLLGSSGSGAAGATGLLSSVAPAVPWLTNPSLGALIYTVMSKGYK